MEFPGDGEFCKQLYSNMDLIYFRAPGKGNGFTTKTKKLRKTVFTTIEGSVTSLLFMFN